MSKGVKLRVWGDYACFTRPEMKVERVSYDVMTPSSARGILEAIYWKPSIRWVIKAIHVIRPISFTNIRRNELASKLSLSNVKSAMKGTKDLPPLFIEDDRQQRAAMVLKRVEYVIEAEFEVLTDEQMAEKGYEIKGRKEDDRSSGKHLRQIEDRMRDGRFYKQPVFGCREFPANFELIEGDLLDWKREHAKKLSEDERNEWDDEKLCPKSLVTPEKKPRDLNWMLYDMDFTNPEDIRPMFFQARMTNGVVEVPHPESKEVKR